jgi:hypothetical protein
MVLKRLGRHCHAGLQAVGTTCAGADIATFWSTAACLRISVGTLGRSHCSQYFNLMRRYELVAPLNEMIKEWHRLADDTVECVVAVVVRVGK